ncbi:LOW QUALITY PROTEIN: hypothetical protein CXG81DRAFT_29465 [Caulochytrium protostelioides]|uniref:cysteine-S-conjugate beta-lyase n=1 Tax=Caulochytrium protostelioides TaxID=1555241 RepID=A0A4P9XB83_9FUNG|nr:LOW QUALITY PROTEIN: hypothetical protein CXG81DRAFT_29465 [Caulochytrium protostelioides]|eukprot:RKP02667.1 LOW QUALITY PROTEIN: hypothetical protein CXG81DRAFT_29465 [Caulochytrium protostelioides]
MAGSATGIETPAPPHLLALALGHALAGAYPHPAADNSVPPTGTSRNSSDRVVAAAAKKKLPKRRYRPATECVFVDTEISDQYNASSIPIYQSATFKQPSINEPGAYDYSRSGNPTRTHVEQHLAKLMHATRAFVCSSGMGALDVITRLVRPGDELIAGDDLYGGTQRLLTFLQKHMGIVVHHIDTTRPDSIRPFLRPGKTTMVLLETPTNPLMKVADIPTISEIVHAACPDALVVVDNTMMSPYLMRPLNLGADITYDSGTKYLSGHHDLMAGVIGVRDPALAERIYFIINSTGCGLAPFDCFLLMRGIKTLAVRVERQQESAMLLAKFLESKGITVHYPGLPSHPQHALHMQLAAGGGAVLAIETGDVALSEKLVALTHLYAISVSFGCVNSLISMPCRMSHASIPAASRNFPEDLVRICVGDLVEDLDEALRGAGVYEAAAPSCLELGMSKSHDEDHGTPSISPA